MTLTLNLEASLVSAVDARCLSSAANLLAHGASPNAAYIDDVSRVPLLFKACSTGNRALATLLLLHGANPDAQMEMRTGRFAATCPALIAAIDCPLLLQDLLRHGADPNLPATWNGRATSPLRFACGRPAALRLLSRHGALLQ